MTTRLSDPESESLGYLVTKLTDDTSLLVRQEIELAKRDLRQALDAARTELLKAAVGGAVAYAGALALVAGVILLLGLIVPMWLSALLIGGATATTGAVMLQRGKGGLEQIDVSAHRPFQNSTFPARREQRNDH